MSYRGPKGSNKSAAKKMEEIRKKQGRDLGLGKLGGAIKSFFSKDDAKKKAKKTKKFLDDKKVSDFKKGLQGN